MAVPADLIKATTERFQKRTVEREDTLKKIEAGPPSTVDTPERVRQRVDRLMRQAEAAGEAPADLDSFNIIPSRGSGPRTAAQPSVARLGLERVLGENNLIGIAYLALGVQVARSVGRVAIRTNRLRLDGFGTGFLVSPSLLLTNNHVLDETNASTSQVEFNFEDTADGQRATSVTFDLDPATFFITDPALDFTLVAIKDADRHAEALAGFGWNRLIEAPGKALLGEALNIVQHPNGEPKQVALRENLLVDVLPDFLHYKTDTAPGSSGSAVYNDQWEVVALHHSGVPRTDKDGKILALDGSIWSPAMGEHRIDWLANEGVRVSRIVQHVKAVTTLSGSQRHLRDALFDEASSSAPTAPLSTSTSTARGGATFSRQPAVWTSVAPPRYSKADAPTRTTMPQSAPPPTPPPTPPSPPSPQRSSAPPPPSSPSAQTFDVAPPAFDGTGTVTWTLPITIRVQLGDAIASLGSPASASAPAPAARAATPPSSSMTSTQEDERREALDTLREAETRVYLDEARDATEKADYYQGIDETATEEELFQALSALLDETHTTRPGYKPAVRVYPWVDLQENRKLRSVYSSQEFEPADFIEEDFRVESLRDERLRRRIATESLTDGQRDEAVALLEAALPFNCEHVVPQSWFSKREPMRGDMHHLFACESGCNSFRGNIAYFDFPDFEEAVRTSCGKRETGKFEPGNGKGLVARATLYFLLRYPGMLNASANDFDEDRLQVLLAWHATHPVSRYERHRNQAIFDVQGNRNPLIDHPEWANRIAFETALR